MSTTDLFHQANEWSHEFSSERKYAVSGRILEDFPQDAYASPASRLFQQRPIVVHGVAQEEQSHSSHTSVQSFHSCGPGKLQGVEIAPSSGCIGVTHTSKAYKDAVHRQESEEGSPDGPTQFNGRTEVLPRPEGSHGPMAVSAMYTNPNNTRAEVMAQCELQTGTASSIDPSSSHPALIHVILEQENQQPDLRNIDSSAKECGCDLHNPVKKCPEHEYQLESERLALQELRDAFDPSENLPEDEDAFLAFVAQRIRDLGVYHSPARAKL